MNTTTNPRAVRLAYHRKTDHFHCCLVCEQLINGYCWVGDVNHLSDHHQDIALCDSCASAPIDFRAELDEKADKLFAAAAVARDLAANLLAPTPDEIREATVIPNLPFSGALVSKDAFDEWLGSRKTVAAAVDPNTCEHRLADDGESLYFRDGNTRGWVHETDVPPGKVAIVRDRLKPRPPAPYSERDPAPLPF
jgi:hypothetical protein